MKPLRYFLDPLNFSYRSKDFMPCEICGISTICFTENAFFGKDKLKFVCCNCLNGGLIKGFGMSCNDISDVDVKLLIGSRDEIESKIDAITYRTPNLPSWQDIWWPVCNGDFCVFHKICSKLDFFDKNELFESIREEDRYGNDADKFWSMLPDGEITNLDNGNYSISFYLFKSNNKKVVLWDCN